MASSGPRRRYWPRVLGTVLALAVIAVLVLAWFLQPARLTAMILQGAGRNLHAELRTDGPGRYALLPEPHLVLPGLSATLPGQTSPFFRSGQVELALPWQTLRGNSSDISSIVLESPDVDLPTLNKWLATLPPSTEPLRFPHLTRGMQVHDATLRSAQWRVEHCDLVLPSLADGAPMSLETSGELVRGTVTSKFDLKFAATPSGVGRGMRIVSSRATLVSDGELPSLTADGNVLLSDTIAIDLRGSFQHLPPSWSDATDASFALPGDIPFAIALDKGKPRMSSANPLQSLLAMHGYRLHLALGDPKRQPALTFDADATTGALVQASAKGQLSRWPEALQMPFALPANAAPIAFDASYQGPVLMTSPIVYEVHRGDRTVQGKFFLGSVLAWIARGLDFPLPPVVAAMNAAQIGSRDDPTPASTPDGAIDAHRP